MERHCLLDVRVTPLAARDEFAGWQGETLRVRLKAPPVDGRANAARVRFLAEALGIAASDVALVSGAGGRTKRLRVSGLGPEEVRRRLGA